MDLNILHWYIQLQHIGNSINGMLVLLWPQISLSQQNEI